MTARDARYDLATTAYDLDGAVDGPVRTVVICTSRRCGSTLLGEALHRAGGLGCPLEYLHAGFRPRFAARWGTPDLASYLQALYRYRVDSSGTLGVKLFWPDVLAVCAERYPADGSWFAGAADPRPRARLHARIAELFAGFFPDPTYVFLWRRDLVRQAVSDCRAARTGRWRSLDPHTGPVPDPCIDIDVDDIAASVALFADQRRQWRCWFDEQGITPIEVIYEDLASHYAATVRELAVRLGGADPDAAAAPPRLHRQSDTDSERLVARYLAATLRRRPLTDAAPAGHQ